MFFLQLIYPTDLFPHSSSATSLVDLMRSVRGLSGRVRRHPRPLVSFSTSVRKATCSFLNTFYSRSSDFENKFVCGEIMSYEDLKEYGSEAAVKAAGKLRQQGKPYESTFTPIYSSLCEIFMALCSDRR